MDTIKIGEFLSQLRREQGLTQEQLGEELGVSNKTISRWENGNYLPPVEMLQALSRRYSVSINELLSGQRLGEEAYRAQAEENIKSALESGFDLREKLSYHKKEWMKKHWPIDLMVLGLDVLLIAFGVGQDGRGLHLLSWFLISAYILIRYNVMMAYAQRKAFGSGEETGEDKNERLLKRVRVTALILLTLSIWITVDLTLNYVSALVPEMNDGITVRGMWSAVFYGLDGHRWSIINYYKGFAAALKVTGALGMANLLLACHNLESK